MWSFGTHQACKKVIFGAFIALCQPNFVSTEPVRTVRTVHSVRPVHPICAVHAVSTIRSVSTICSADVNGTVNGRICKDQVQRVTVNGQPLQLVRWVGVK